MPIVMTVFCCAMIDQHALEDLVEIERLTRRVAVIPLQLAGVGIERDRGAGIERGAVAGAAARPHPGLGLGHAPVGEIEFGIVGARDPGLAARAIEVVQSVPGVATRSAFEGDGGETPILRAGLGVVRR